MTERFKKSEALARWRSLPKDAPLRPHAIANGHTGSTYGHDGIRIEGSTAFIDSVLGRLTDLIACENSDTRIALNYQKVQPREGKKASGGDWVCYVKFHQRGPEARHLNRMFGMGGA